VSTMTERMTFSGTANMRNTLVDQLQHPLP
jgi:hypothetical protein